MTKRRDRSRQNAVSQDTADAFADSAGEDSTAVSSLARESAGTRGTESQQQESPPTAKRKRKVRPSERRRKRRKLTITFSDEEIPQRARALAEEWELFALGGAPNVSGAVEYLLMPRLEAAERGDIEPPPVRRDGLVDWEQIEESDDSDEGGTPASTTAHKTA